MNPKLKANLWWMIPLAIFLAYLFKELVQMLVIEPLTFLWFIIRVYYKAIPQPLIWSILTIVIGLIGLGGMTSGKFWFGEAKRKVEKPRGQVESLAYWMGRARKSNYFKWVVANRLGRLASALVGRDQLTGPGKNRGAAPNPAQAYLIAGLETSSTDYPRSKLFTKSQKTDLDVPADEVVTYLESLME